MALYDAATQTSFQAVFIDLVVVLIAAFVGLMSYRRSRHALTRALRKILSQSNFAKIDDLAGDVKGIFSMPRYLTEIPLSLSTRSRLAAQEKKMGILAVLGAA